MNNKYTSYIIFKRCIVLYKKKLILLTAAICSIVLLSACSKKGALDDTALSNVSNNDEYFPVSSISLTDREVASINNSLKVKLYYKTAKGDKLSCETKLIQFTDKDKKNDVLASKIVEMLISGPSNSNLVKTIPEGTALNSVKITSNTIYIDFNEAFCSALNQTSDTDFIAYSITNTLTEFKNIDEVVITSCKNKISNTVCDFSSLHRNMKLVTDLESAMPEADYSENVFLEIETE